MRSKVLSRCFCFALTSACLALGSAGCSGEASDPDVELPGGELSGSHVLAEFRARLDPAGRTLTFERLDRGSALGTQSIDEVPIESDGVAGSGTAGTVELITNSTTSAPGLFSGNVTLRHFFPRPLSNVFVEAYHIDPDDGQHNAVGDDDSEYGLNSEYGLWKYTATAYQTNGLSGYLGQSTPHNEGARDWTFNDPDGASTSIFLRVVTSLDYATYAQGTNGSSLALSADPVYNGCSQTGAIPGTFATVAGDEIFASKKLPFTFTIYDTDASHIAFSPRGVVTFGTSATDAESRQTTSGQNLGLPSTSAPRPALFAFWDDIRVNDFLSAIDGTPGQMCYKVVGSVPYRKVVVGWEDFRFGNSLKTDNLNFSAVLYEATNRVEVLYHQMVSTDVLRAAGGSATIGVQDASGSKARGTVGQASTGGLTDRSLMPAPL